MENSTDGGSWQETLESNDHIDLPQILSRSKTSLLSALSKLGAADVVECYILTRSAKLEPFSSHDIHKLDHTQLGYALEVRKSAIAFFYRPKGTKSSSPASSAAPDSTEKQLQLTLEYGPLRAGALLNYDTVPTVMYTGTDEKYVSWSNDAKIYYTFSSNVTEIQGWDNAYFMAPMTGAVLSKVFDYILDYTTHHPRYQPFVVRSTNTTQMTKNISKSSSSVPHISKSTHHSYSSKDLIVLESSNSDDFVRNVIDQLALLYVDFHPILTPNFYALELYVADAKRDSIYLSSYSMIQDYEDEGTNDDEPISVAHAAALFYNKLYSCIWAEQTGDYSAFIPLTSFPTSSPSVVSTQKPTVGPTTKPSAAPTYPPTYKPTTLPTFEHTKSPTLERTNSPTLEPTASESYIFNTESSAVNIPPSSVSPVISSPTSSPTTLNPTFTFFPTTFQPSFTPQELTEDETNWHRRRPPQRKQKVIMKKKSHQIQQRIDSRYAMQHENVLAFNDNTHHHGNVRNSFSHPLQRILSTSAEKDKVPSTTAIIISTCLSDPKYGIRRLVVLDSNLSNFNATPTITTRNSSTTHVYLYMDGGHYLRINTTDPFLAIVSAPLSIATVKPIPEAKWDIVDWLIVLLIVYGFIYGIISILDHIGLVDMQLFCVRWKKAKVAYANARATSLTDLNDAENDPADEEMDDYGEVEDAVPGRFIPSSMGGWRKYSPSHPTRLLFAMKRSTPHKYQRSPLLRGSSSMEDDDSLHTEEGITDVNPKPINLNGYERLNMTPRSPHDEISPRGDTTRTRKMIPRPPKDPDTVDIPDLSFSSPIAVPASASRSPSAEEATQNVNNGIMA